MPRGDKDKYTDKEKRQARHIEKVTRSAVCPKKKLSVALGQQSMRSITAEKNPAAAVMANPRTMSPCGRVDERVAVANHQVPIDSRSVEALI